ncbi:MAG TPA: hypothetical protein VFJ19_04135 [Nocardioidaceae bacterium]|nr:hypothetical protein [Nocardioidaceae bacterium]
MTGNLAFFWSRAESHVYRQLKQLAGDELTVAVNGATGRRRRGARTAAAGVHRRQR